MARTFTTFFFYHGKTYTAVISQLDGTMRIYIPDESLHHIIPGGVVTYQSAEGIKIDRPKLNPAQHLLLNVLTSIEVQNKAAI